MPVALGVNGGVLGSNNLPTATTFRGVFTPNEVARAISLGFWPVNKSQAVTGVAGSGALGTLTVGATADPYFEYTTLLLPGNGTNGAQNNTFLDGSTNNFTITRNGNTTQGTFSPFSQTGWGNYFDGTGDYLSVPANAAFQLGTGDFSIEAWIYPTTTPGGQYPVVIRLESGGYNSNGLTLFWRRYNVNPNGVSVDCGGVVALAGTSTVALNTWTHVAVTRTGTTFALFVNGTREATTTSSNNFSVNDSVYIGDSTSDTEFPGYISNVRIVKGSNVYGVGTTLTVPTAPLTAISGTSLLTCQSNRFIDNSGNNFTVTPAGNTSVQAFSPFNPTASWSAATYGGSGYFDGNGDYLSVGPLGDAAFNFGTNAFTLEAWIYPAVALSASSYSIVFGVHDGVTNTSWALYARSNGIFIYGAGNNFVGGGTINPNEWAHVAITRSSNTVTAYINGTQVAQNTGISGSYDNSGDQFKIGDDDGAGVQWNGYISNIRIVKGQSLTTGSFTPPTTPVTTSSVGWTGANVAGSITGTISLLCNFTNAGIYDATSKNDLETVGNAQISTTQSKFGGSSMSFDGTGDYLRSPASPLFNFNTGDFTVEAWVYTSSAVAYATVIDKSIGSGGTTGWFLEWSSTRGIWFFYQGSSASAAYTVATGQWYHLAVSKSGLSLRLFVNGVQQGSTATVTADITSTYGVSVGASNGTPQYQLNGYIQDLRITKGYARYTANFTPPTAAFPTL